MRHYQIVKLTCKCGRPRINPGVQNRCRECQRDYQKATRHRWKTPPVEYALWAQMRQRCANPNSKHFKNYGGRGIRVCERWQVFENFIADMGVRPSTKHTLERIDNNGNYEPGNVTWATRAAQQRNRRNNVEVTYKAKTQVLKDWATEYGVHPSTLYSRWLRGWNFERALTEPVGKYRR